MKANELIKQIEKKFSDSIIIIEGSGNTIESYNVIREVNVIKHVIKVSR